MADIYVHIISWMTMREPYKLLKGYYNLGFFTLSPVQNTRGHHMKKLYKHSRLNLREKFLTQRVINMRNSLTETVVSASMLSIFKQQLNQFWNSIGYEYVQRPGVPKPYF